MPFRAQGVLACCVLAALLSGGCRTENRTPENTAAAATSTTADAELAEYRLRALETSLQAMPEGPEREYFSGMLAERSGRFDEAIDRLNRTLPRLRGSNPKRAAMALEAIASSYLATNRYGDAAQAYSEIAAGFAGQLDHDVADDAAYSRMLGSTAPQTIAWKGPVLLKTSTNPIGSRTTQLTVNGVREEWLLDTGANQSVVSRSFARRLGLTPLPGAAPAGAGVTGLRMDIQVAVLPTLQLGAATLGNVVLMVFDDENLKIRFGDEAYQINAILGYPVFKALGAVTFTRDELRAGDAADKSTSGARMYMRGLGPAIECEVEGIPLLFTFDTGASGTDLSVRYFEQFKSQAGTWKKDTVQSGGAGGSITHEVYRQPGATFTVGAQTVTLRDVSVLPVRRNAGIDVLFGNLGQDFVEGFESFTLNFSTMTFSLGAPLSK